MIFQSSASWSPSLKSCTTTDGGPALDCGWENAGVGECKPKTSVTLNPSGGCGESCEGDPMVRVCRGLSACEPGTTNVLAYNEHACGTPCPSVTFTCPDTGSYTVMTGTYSSALKSKVELQASAGTYPYMMRVEGTALSGILIDAELSDGGTVPMKISEVRDELPAFQTPEGQTYRYQLQVWNVEDGGSWEDLCGEDLIQDEAGDDFRGAIAVAGYWNQKGEHISDGDLITFACRMGVVNKCYRWGYQPWKFATKDRTCTTLWDYHQACARMARADYCGDGFSWTNDNTPIDLAD